MIMKTRHARSRKSAAISNSRWAAYATAGAATALAAVNTAEADIHWSGPVNEQIQGTFGLGNFDRVYFELDAPGNSFGLIHIMASSGSAEGVARFFASNTYYGNPIAGAFAGFFAAGFNYVSKLASGNNISANSFNTASFGTMAFRGGYPNEQWKDPGIGFIGFRFDSGSGTQYGWIRIDMSGVPLNSMTIIDYAFADPGEAILAGQIPEPGSLALLALGGAGLVAWRKRRAKAAA
jgi:PEP-CTERM motif-containing protein